MPEEQARALPLQQPRPNQFICWRLGPQEPKQVLVHLQAGHCRHLQQLRAQLVAEAAHAAGKDGGIQVLRVPGLAGGLVLGEGGQQCFLIEAELPGSGPPAEHSRDAGLPVDKGSVAVEAQRVEVGQPYGSCLLRENNGSPARPAGRNWPARGAAAARPPSHLSTSTTTACEHPLNRDGRDQRPVRTAAATSVTEAGRCLAGLKRWRRLPATRSSHRGYPAPRQPTRTSRLRLARSDEGERTAA